MTTCLTAEAGIAVLLKTLEGVSITRAMRYRELGTVFGGEHIHPHMHHWIYLLHGETTIDLGDYSHAVSADHILYVPAGVRHGSKRHRRRTFDSIEVRFALPDISLPEMLTRTPAVWSVRNIAAMRGAFERLTAAFLADPSPDNWLARLRLAETLLLAAQERSLSHGETQGGDLAWRVRTVARHIASHFAESLTVPDLAALAGLSPSHFSASFRDILGVSPIEYAIRHRIHHAKDLLRDTRMTVDEIARITGFSTGRYLARVLKQRTGRTPSALRSYPADHDGAAEA